MDPSVCVCDIWSHRDAFAFVLPQGDTAPDCRPCLTKLCNLVGYPAWPAGRTCDFPSPYGKRLSQEPHYLVFFRASVLFCRCARAAVNLFDSLAAFDLTLLASLPLPDPRIRWSLLVFLGNGTLGRRVAPHSHQYAYP